MPGLPIDKFTFLPEEEAINPTKGQYFELMNDQWWVVHPDRGLAFYNPSRNQRAGLGYPQCNIDETIARALSDDGHLDWPHEVKFFSRVFVPVNRKDV
jgi:hypothetical protein